MTFSKVSAHASPTRDNTNTPYSSRMARSRGMMLILIGAPVEAEAGGLIPIAYPCDLTGPGTSVGLWAGAFEDRCPEWLVRTSHRVPAWGGEQHLALVFQVKFRIPRPPDAVLPDGTQLALPIHPGLDEQYDLRVRTVGEGKHRAIRYAPCLIAVRVQGSLQTAEVIARVLRVVDLVGGEFLGQQLY